MSKDKIVNGYYQPNITTSKQYENSTYTMKYANQEKLIEKLQQENQRLKEQYCERTDCAGRLGHSKRVELLESVIEEVREHIETQKKKPYKSLSEKATICNKYNELLQILDKVKEVK